RDITFAYNHNRNILAGAELTIPKNHRIGLIGASGAGKTTVVDLLTGLLTPTAGAVTVDGRDIREDLRAWQANIGYIPQKIFIFNASIRANIVPGVPREQIDATRLQQAVTMAQLDTFLSRLPEGADTMVGENGIRLSGGELQRLGIARALYRNPELLVMDEATSALDNATEQEFMAAIDALAGKKTLVIIAHRLSTVEKCDTVYRVEQGRIVPVTFAAATDPEAGRN
ncbi:MAG: ATP-binding cassette domain-containing protein, partial [Victivallales bacterium]|nr:ATP-binding cassette domain-containing protein [Victivallales bacterium]